MTWLLAHRWVGIPALVAAAFAVGRISAPRPAAPRVELHDLRGYESDGANHVVTVEKEGPVREGPVRIVTRTVTKPGPGCTGAEVERVVTEERAEVDRGPVVTETARTEEHREIAVERRDMVVTPAPPRPGWALQLGVEDVLGTRPVRVAARRRLIGPVWAELAVVPGRRTLGVAAAVEW